MEIHPSLTRPHAPVLRRPDGSVQIGVGPAALHLGDVTADEARWLVTLDGVRPLSTVLAEAAVHGTSGERAAELVDRLAAEGHLVLGGDACAPAGRVVVAGAGALPRLVADVLAAHPGSLAVVRSRSDAPAARADVVVLTSSTPPVIGDALPWRRRGVTVLPVVCGETQATVGPLLLPGHGPCLHCLELTRARLDPAWPWLRAQLSRPRVEAAPSVDGRAPVRLLAAGLATSLVLDHLAGSTHVRGWAYDVATPGPTLERHRWEVHPECPACGVPPAVEPALDEVG